MTENIRHLLPTDRISNMYAKCDQTGNDNIFTFVPPLSVKALEIIDDVSALLEDPNTRSVAEEILSEAIYEIAAKLSTKQ